jgi:hypothetical protein
MISASALDEVLACRFEDQTTFTALTSCCMLDGFSRSFFALDFIGDELHSW